MDMFSLNKRAFGRISAKRNRPWANEEEVRLAWVPALEEALGIHFNAERARNDSRYNNVIIEFKGPGLFYGSQTSAKFKEAMYDRLLPYISRISQSEGLPSEDYIGIAIDGEHICFVQVRGGDIYPQPLLPFSEHSVGLVTQALKADTRRAVTASNLISDFGHGSSIASSLMQAMSNALAAEMSSQGNSKTRMLFEEWRTLYGQVADMSVLQASAINQEICFTWRGQPEDSMPGRLFVIHTYNSLLIKLLAAEIVAAHGLTSSKYPAQTMIAVGEDAALIHKLRVEIEHSGIFAQAGINGFVEEAIFSWYLDVAQSQKYSEELLRGLRAVLAALSLYRTDRLTDTRDVLRDLYQGLVPGKLRQSLGEFYTPDWLVDLAIDLGQRGPWLAQRVLDPCCGSGAFLVAMIRRMKDEGVEKGWSPASIVQHLCQAVWGFDLNPLAVQTSRVNFLIEIADLLRQTPGTMVEIPILLADAIYSPAPDPQTGQCVVNYKIGSKVAGLDINLPAALAVDRARLDHVFVQMAEDVEADLEYDIAEAGLVAAGLISESESLAWREPLKHTYNQILALHRQQWNGIWFRIVRNFFWSATAGRFDAIIGNPPWVRWSKLPEAYRDRVKPTCERYDIFSKTKRHGGNELDISAMITYTTADKWLVGGGRLTFLLPGTLFKNPSSAGFRQFRLDPTNPNSPHLAPVSVDDMKALRPFDAANHTVIAIFDKGNSPGAHPVPYRVWDSATGSGKAIPSELTLEEVLARTSISAMEAAPVGHIGSPWAVLPPGRYASLKALAGVCNWTEGRKGITTDLNGVYFVPIVEDNGRLVKVRSRPDAGKKNIGPAKEAWVEPTLLYPLVKGAGDFEACYLRLTDPKRTDERLYTFVPNTGISSLDYRSSETAMNGTSLRLTKKWFSDYKPLLSQRSTYRRQMQGAPFYAIYNIGDYTFKPWKVIWPEMSSKFYAAVVGSADVPIAGQRVYIPDHKIYFSAFDSREQAYFLCGLLNAPMVGEWIESHNITINLGDIFKHLQLPEFRPDDPQHIRLTTLVEQAHREHDPKVRASHVKAIECLGNEILDSSRHTLTAQAEIGGGVH
jgi:SAM-dependent methyltransferase